MVFFVIKNKKENFIEVISEHIATPINKKVADYYQKSGFSGKEKKERNLYVNNYSKKDSFINKK
tara:strand:- start:1195 stop:1386 length:192 start_codon:yes stop_codon:yes gene_type:complete